MNKFFVQFGAWAIAASAAQGALMTTIQNINPQRAGGANTAAFVAFDASTGGARLGDDASFETFCLETTAPPVDGTFFVRIETAADNGGAGGQEPDPISPGTAYLYTTLRTNPSALNPFVTSSASFTGTDEQRLRAISQLQQAIWRLENESGGVANSLFMHAIASGWTDIGAVRVMQLWDTYDAATGTYAGAQNDMLFLPTAIPAPQAVLLGLIGLGAIVSLGRYSRV